MMKELYALGIGFTTPVFIEIAIDCGYTIAGLYHYNNDRTGEMDHGYKILGSFEDLFSQDLTGKLFLLTMGDMRIRKDLTDRIYSRGGIIPTLIHPTARVSKFAHVSQNGVLISPNCIVQADVTIADGVVMRDQALICHTTNIESFVFIGPQALVGALLNIKEFVFIGQKSLLISKKAKIIGPNSIVGAGSVVTKSFESGTTVIGNPAKLLETKGTSTEVNP